MKHCETMIKKAVHVIFIWSTSFTCTVAVKRAYPKVQGFCFWLQIGKEENEFGEIEVTLIGQKEDIYKAKKLIFKCGVTFYGGDNDYEEEGKFFFLFFF